MRLLCIDPGPTTSGVVTLETPKSSGLPNVAVSAAKHDSEALIEGILNLGCDHMAIEGIQSYGMAVGSDVFETAEMIGRLRQAFGFARTTKIYRGQVKIHLCNSMRAKDANIRQAILDLYPPTGGGKTPQIGTKSQPGPLYGVSSHAWSALAVGLTYLYGVDSDGRRFSSS